MFHDSLVEFGVGAGCGGHGRVCVWGGGGVCSDGWAGRGGGATLRVTGKGGE